MSIEKKFPWSFSGFLIGLIALIVSVIIFYYTESKDKFDFNLVIEDEFNLIELKDILMDLKIIYKEEDILEQNKEIKIIIYSFTNEGKLIIQDYYDRYKEFAIEFCNSEVLSTTIISSNSEYLKKDFLTEKKDSINKSIVRFNKLIFESGKKITLKSYLIQDKGIQNTQIKFIGKIAGIDEFNAIRKTDQVVKGQILNKTTTKITIWFFVIYFGLLMGLIIVTKIQSLIERKRFEKTWIDFIIKYPDYKISKDIFETIKFNSRLNRIVTRMIEGETIIDIRKYILKPKHLLSLLEFTFGPKNWISFPMEIFVIDNNNIKIKTDLFELYKNYYDFNNHKL